MTNTDAVLTLLHISNEDLQQKDLTQLQNWLGSLRCVTRQIEREIVHREIKTDHQELILQH